MTFRRLLIIIFALSLVLLAGCSSKTQTTVQETPEKYKLQCQKLDYQQLARNPENYKSTRVTYFGKVAQTKESGNDTVIRLNVNNAGDAWKDTILVNYKRPEGANRILEGDVIQIWGAVKGLKSYTSVSGVEVAVPEIDAIYAEVKTESKPTSGGQPSSAVKQSTPVQGSQFQDFRSFVQLKERINTDIIELASQINNRIGQNGDLRNSADLKMRARRIVDEIAAYSNELANKSFPTEFMGARTLLMQLFDLETTRARSLYNGLVEGSNGQNYQSSFAVGTNAAYKFDEVNSRFIQEYGALESRYR